MRHLLLFLFIGISYSPLALGQALKSAENEYLLLVTKIKQENNDEDFDELRKVFVKTLRYTPYSGPEMELRRLYKEAVKNADWSSCITKAREAINYNFTNIDAHTHIRYCFSQTGILPPTSKQNKSRLNIIAGLLSAIRRTGDGLSPETAYKTINISEIHSFLKLSSLFFKSQRLVAHKELGEFDLITAVDGKTGKETSLYFDVNLQKSKLRERTKHNKN